jgi:hypothetical protein
VIDEVQKELLGESFCHKFMRMTSLQNTQLGLFHKKKTNYKIMLGWLIGFFIMIALVTFAIDRLGELGKVTRMMDSILDVSTPPKGLEDLDPNNIEIYFEAMNNKDFIGEDFCKQYMAGGSNNQIEVEGGYL